eukprot:157494_1
MRILFRMDGENNLNQNEWCIVELQGSIASPISTTLHNMSLGKMNYNEEGKPILTIGNGVLTGKLEKLKKPIIITHTKAIDTNNGLKELKVIAIAKSKLVFKHRPKIVIINSNPSNKKMRLSQI